MKKTYAHWVKIAAWAATITATFLIILKLFAWLYTGSMSLLASLVDSCIDLLASAINLVVIRYALQPADDEHRFGHGKAESLAALSQAAFIVGSAGFLVLNSIERLFRPTEVVEPSVGIIVSAVVSVVTLMLISLQKWVIKKTASQAIAADSLHYQSDLLMNLAIMVALGLTWYGFSQIDAIFAIIIGIGILVTAAKMAYEAVQSLLDKQLPITEQQKIITIARSVSGVINVHNLRTRQAGATKFIQLHIELNDHIPLIDAHFICDQVEDLLVIAFAGADITLHQEPVSIGTKHRLEANGFK